MIMRIGRIANRPYLAGMFLMILTLLGCTAVASSGVEFKPAAGADTAPAGVPTTLSENPADRLSPRLGFVQEGEATAMENGGRVALGKDKIAEVFLVPYPPDWQTDLNLFLLDGTTYQPISDVDVDLKYDMVYMDHGIDTQTGTKVKEGHYVLPLSFLMYGDWSVDVTVAMPEGKKHLRFVVKFFPN